MTKVICTTTIYPPSEALRKFAAMKDWTLVIAGDLKTPHHLHAGLHDEFPGKVHYLTPEFQNKFDRELSDAIGWNCIQRRNMAFLYACKELKADIISSVDDDNSPIDGWGENLMVGKNTECALAESDTEVFDPLGYCANKSFLWHRGFPLELVNSRSVSTNPARNVSITPMIQADMWLGEPDVDAICRMVHHASEITYEPWPFPFTSNSPSPFNSQNTFLHKDVMPHYFMALERGRHDDLLAAYYVQSKGFKVVYGKPSVRQERNNHDVMKDFANEIWGYQNILQVIRDLKASPDNFWNHLTPLGQLAFRLYQKHFE